MNPYKRVRSVSPQKILKRWHAWAIAEELMDFKRAYDNAQGRALIKRSKILDNNDVYFAIHSHIASTGLARHRLLQCYDLYKESSTGAMFKIYSLEDWPEDDLYVYGYIPPVFLLR